MSDRYAHPYPSPEAAAAHPFVPLSFTRLREEEMHTRAEAFLAEMKARRSVRMLSDDPVPRRLIELAIATAATAPSGAHRQPWTFVAVDDPTTKHEIRLAAEVEEQANYQGGRMNDEWRRALAPLGTDAHKEFLEVAPWLVVLFEQRYGIDADGGRRHHYYVKESVGIAAGMFITALHHMGLVTLTHTPTPMAFLSRVLGRPDNERPFVLFPVGYPVEGALVPDLARKPLDEVMVVVEGRQRS
jgi:nitroreductase